MRSAGNLLHRSLCDSMIIALIIVFIFQSLSKLFFGADYLVNFFGCSVAGASSWYVWTLISYGFLHGEPWHLVLNLLGIHFIGRPVERILGTRPTIFFCLASLLFGALFWLPISQGSSVLLGFSAVVLAALAFYCLNQPHQPITLLLLFVLPLRLKPLWVLVATACLETYGLIFHEAHGMSNVAHSAHLGGMSCGALAFLLHRKKISIPLKVRFVSSSQSLKTPSSKPSSYKVDLDGGLDVHVETDRILDKINEFGFGSLTTSEKKTLEKAKKLLRK